MQIRGEKKTAFELPLKCTQKFALFAFNRKSLLWSRREIDVDVSVFLFNKLWHEIIRESKQIDFNFG